MKARWFAPTLLLATVAVTAPAHAQFAIDLMVGPNFSSISNAPAGYSTSSDVGYFLGGRLRFGHLFYVSPGLDYQYQSVNIDGTSVGEPNDNIGISSFMIPLGVGVNLNAKVVAIQLGVSGTLAFNTSVNDNDFGLTKDETNNTRWGWMVSAGARILAFQLNLAWQSDFTDTFKDDPNGSKLSQFRVGLGIAL